MSITIRPATEQERQFTYAQPNCPEITDGCIGYLRGDFGRDGDEFWTTWFDVHPELKTNEFKEAFDKVINALRFAEAGGGLLKNRSCMNNYCQTQPDSGFDGNYTKEYAFRIDTPQYSYVLRCIPVRGDYNFYCVCYVRQILDSYLSATMCGDSISIPHELTKSNDAQLLKLYEEYKLSWMIEHGYTLSDLIACMEVMIHEDSLDGRNTKLSKLFDAWEFGVGFASGVVWPCFEEFCQNELMDKLPK